MFCVYFLFCCLFVFVFFFRGQGTKTCLVGLHLGLAKTGCIEKLDVNFFRFFVWLSFTTL